MDYEKSQVYKIRKLQYTQIDNVKQESESYGYYKIIEHKIILIAFLIKINNLLLFF